MEVPNSPHALVANPFTRINKPNAPRVLRDVQGDFEVSVRVDGQFEPNGNDPRPAFAAEVRAGLIVFLDEDNFIMLDRSAVQRNGKINKGVGIQVRVPNRGRGNRNPRLGGQGPTYLRLARKGAQIVLSARSEGANWEPAIGPIDVPWPERLKVGLVTTSSSIEPFSVTFGEYSFTGD
jgi:regulation of enolase protein 1 (concanavalin A-like superfamily)